MNSTYRLRKLLKYYVMKVAQKISKTTGRLEKFSSKKQLTEQIHSHKLISYQIKPDRFQKPVRF